MESWLGQLQPHDIPQTVNQTLRVARQIEAQDVEVVADGLHQLRRGVAKDRRISIEDPTIINSREDELKIESERLWNIPWHRRGHWQGRKARYIGLRKNLFDLRRAAVVHNLHVLARGFEQALHQPNYELSPLWR